MEPLAPAAVSVWGYCTWTFLHTLAAKYPHSPTLDQKRAAKDLFESLAEILPCTLCQGHYTKLIAESPPAVNSRNDLVHWLWAAHNLVNERLGKPTVAFADCLRRFNTIEMPQWGPYAWRAMHLICFGAPEQFTGSQQSAYARFFGSLAWVMPFESARVTYVAVVRSKPLGLDKLTGRSALSRWMVDVHNMANFILLKPEQMAYEEAKQLYGRSVAPCSDGKQMVEQAPTMDESLEFVPDSKLKQWLIGWLC